MSFRTMPDTMVGYATHELAELLRELTPKQRESIGRIVQHVYIQNQPWADLFRGDDKICSETIYYRRGTRDPDTGELTRVGWSHQDDFNAALNMASRLALQSQEREELDKLRKAKRKAVEKAEDAVGVWVTIMEDPAKGAFNRLVAGDRVVELAFRGQDGESEASGEAADWWRAVEEGEGE